MKDEMVRKHEQKYIKWKCEKIDVNWKTLIHTIIMLVLLGIVIIVLSNIANNIEIYYIMMNLVASMYLNGFPVNVLASSMIISIFSVLSFLTPASSMPGAMIHGCELCTPKAVYQIMPIILVYFTVVCSSIFIIGGSVF